jgi:hypothetical protein
MVGFLECFDINRLETSVRRNYCLALFEVLSLDHGVLRHVWAANTEVLTDLFDRVLEFGTSDTELLLAALEFRLRADSSYNLQQLHVTQNVQETDPSTVAEVGEYLEAQCPIVICPDIYGSVLVIPPSTKGRIVYLADSKYAHIEWKVLCGTRELVDAILKNISVAPDYQLKKHSAVFLKALRLIKLISDIHGLDQEEIRIVSEIFARLYQNWSHSNVWNNLLLAACFEYFACVSLNFPIWPYLRLAGLLGSRSFACLSQGNMSSNS